MARRQEQESGGPCLGWEFREDLKSHQAYKLDGESVNKEKNKNKNKKCTYLKEDRNGGGSGKD
jgi:hypothetical protein